MFHITILVSVLFNPLPETRIGNIMKNTEQQGCWHIPVNQVT
ncbi:hypothetical protein UUU_26520 (plasmid) [Klebsiella pneumoniae subsp. pneumoniae DSM 30104 = JCM 1662 = NBRC 14940]|nr:hypothetical protein UUU_26520 [Klebsiella pneumoniae subsp. pneumoniae DSM 30104 = JCM 1662 = NBRC 14940]